MHSGLPVEKVTIKPTESTRSPEIPKPNPQHYFEAKQSKAPKPPGLIPNPTKHTKPPVGASQPAGDSARPVILNAEDAPQPQSHPGPNNARQLTTNPVGASLLAIAPAQPPSMPKIHHKPTHTPRPNNACQLTTNPCGSQPAGDSASPTTLNAENSPQTHSHPGAKQRLSTHHKPLWERACSR
ncbi:hypothetical protein PS934_04556 [Pseudomonas fluorescens]|nr:hypothetical protein PS934_04556 [Pseudomonas fluorescens]